jgi:endonuclease YncB( thermonuclease family)
MNFKRHLISALIPLGAFFTSTNAVSQNYYITTANDSVPCRDIHFFDTNAQGKMIDFEYVNSEQQTIRLKGKDIPEIARLCQDGTLYLRMPLNLKKPDGYYRY